MLLRHVIPTLLPIIMYPSMILAQNQDLLVTFGNASSETIGDIAVDATGAIYAKGAFQDSIDLDPGPGEHWEFQEAPYGTYLQKLDGDGQFIWGLSMPMPVLTGTSRALDLEPSGWLYHGGTFVDTLDADPGPGVQTMIAQGERNGYVQKFDMDGNLIWAIHLSCAGLLDRLILGNDGSGGVWVYTRFWDELDADPGPGETLLVPEGSGVNNALLHYDANGALLSAGQTSYLNVGHLVTHPNGSLTIVASISASVDVDPGPGTYSLTPSDTYGIAMVQIDVNGELAWAWNLDCSAADYPTWVATDAAGDLYTTGIFEGTLDLDPGPGVYEVTDTGGGDVFVQTLDPLGNLIWATSFGGPETDEGQCVEVDGLGNIYLTGNMRGTVDLDPGMGMAMHTSAGNSDVYFVKLTGTGDHVWSARCGGPELDGPGSMAMDGMGRAHVGAGYRGTSDLDPGPGVLEYTSEGGRDCVIQRFTASTVDVYLECEPLPFIAPNPGFDQLFLTIPTDLAPVRWEIHDMNGHRVMDLGVLPGGTSTVDISSLAIGTYVLTDAEKEHGPQRIVKR